MMCIFLTVFVCTKNSRQNGLIFHFFFPWFVKNFLIFDKIDIVFLVQKIITVRTLNVHQILANIYLYNYISTSVHGKIFKVF